MEGDGVFGQVFEVMEREGRIPNSDELKWEDEIMERKRKHR